MMIDTRLIAACAVWLAVAECGHAIEMCKGGDRAARGVTCLVDGDTLWQDGVKMRLLDIDAPETYEAECAEEKAWGDRATERLRELMAGGYRLENSGEKDRTSDRRDLVRIILPGAGMLDRYWSVRGLLSCGRTVGISGAAGRWLD